MSLSLSALLEEAASRGFLINNLFQLTKTKWRANVTDGEKFWAFGEGPSPEQALAHALANTTYPGVTPVPPPKIKRRATSLTLADLGL